MGTRSGYLSDENMKSMCSAHRQIPMNRLDLLPTQPINISGINMGKMKDPRILSRPSTAATMINNNMNLTGVNVTSEYINGLRTNFQNKMNFNNQTLPANIQQNYGPPSRLNLANLMYLQTALNAGVGMQIASSLSSGPSSLSSGLSRSISSYTQPSEYGSESQYRNHEPDMEPEPESETEEDRNIRLEFSRRGQIGQIVETEEFEQLRTRPPAVNPQQPKPDRAIQKMEAMLRGETQQEPGETMENVDLTERVEIAGPSKSSLIAKIRESFAGGRKIHPY